MRGESFMTSHFSLLTSHSVVGAAFPDIFNSLVRERSRSKIIPASLLLEAYCTGIFPMAMESGDIAWFWPDPRGIIPLDAFHIPHGLKRSLKKAGFQIRLNTAFAAVIRACGERAETRLGSVRRLSRATSICIDSASLIRWKHGWRMS